MHSNANIAQTHRPRTQPNTTAARVPASQSSLRAQAAALRQTRTKPQRQSTSLAMATRMAAATPPHAAASRSLRRICPHRVPLRVPTLAPPWPPASWTGLLPQTLAHDNKHWKSGANLRRNHACSYSVSLARRRRTSSAQTARAKMLHATPAALCSIELARCSLHPHKHTTRTHHAAHGNDAHQETVAASAEQPCTLLSTAVQTWRVHHWL